MVGCALAKPPRQHGLVLVAVLVLVALAAMIAAGVLFSVRAEITASAASEGGEQAYAAAMSGVRVAMAAARSSPDDPAVWHDNPGAFQNRLVFDDGGNRWYFTVYSDAPADAQTIAGGSEGAIRYGLTDESGKINLNAASEAALLALPGMTRELADALLDYRDADAAPRASGSEQDYYDQLAEPYVIANGPLASVEELLLVRGFTAPIVLGEDANLNGTLDPNENDGDETFPPDNGDGRLDTGLRGLVTVWSRDREVDGEGDPRIDLNGDPAALDELGLPDETVQFIRVYREAGRAFAHPSELLEMEHTLARDSRLFPELRAGAVVRSVVTGEALATVMDKLFARGGASGGTPATQPGAPPADGTDGVAAGEPPSQPEEVGDGASGTAKVNVNTAPEAVLAAIPAVGPDLAGQIVGVRGNLDATARGNTAWLYTQGAVDAATYKRIAPSLTARGRQFHLRCVGFGWPSGRYRVLEAVIDTDSPSGLSRILYLRETTRLGLPMALKPDEASARQ